jgi:hypothetical protein
MYRLHVKEYNSGTEYYDGFDCPDNTLVQNLIRTILGTSEYTRLESITFGTKTVLHTDTPASLKMKEGPQYNFHVRLTLNPGEPHNRGIKWKNF